MSFEQIRSQPETVYGQLIEPQTTDKTAVKLELMGILGLRPAEGNNAVTWPVISRALLEATGVEVESHRSPTELRDHLQGMAGDYPWLDKGILSMHPTRPGCSDKLTACAKGHVFIDHIGLLGITVEEAVSFEKEVMDETLLPKAHETARPAIYVVPPLAA